MGSEKLGDGWDVRFWHRRLSRIYFRLFLRDVILIDPAQHFFIAAIFVC
jgi:hypothetical protein